MLGIFIIRGVGGFFIRGGDYLHLRSPRLHEGVDLRGFWFKLWESAWSERGSRPILGGPPPSNRLSGIIRITLGSYCIPIIPWRVGPPEAYQAFLWLFLANSAFSTDAPKNPKPYKP